MKFTIVTTVLLGLVLTPALAVYKTSRKFPIPGGNQILTINRQWDVATVEQKSSRGSWKTIWNYDTGFIATKVLPERACYISIMNRNKIPNFDALPRLVEQNRNVKGHARPTKEITFTLIKRHVRDLKSYGQDIFNMCRGLPTYVAYEFHGPQYTLNQRSCKKLDVLQLLDLIYCHVNINV